MNLKTFLLIIGHEICGSLEQVLFKKSADRLGEHELKSLKNYLSFFKKVLLMPAILWGFLMTVGAWILWLFVLASLDLSVAIPVDSLHYILIMGVSYFYLKERMHWTRVVGTLLVLGGILLVAIS